MRVPIRDLDPLALVTTGSHFESLSDPRHTRNRKHLLVDIVVISICGILCGASGPTAIHRWAKSKREWLAEHLALPHGIPSRDCLRRLLMVLTTCAEACKSLKRRAV